MHDIEKTEKQEEDPAGGKTRILQFGHISPTKPQGILMTPGTATSRRKTVSFGHEVEDKPEKNANEKSTAKAGTMKDVNEKLQRSAGVKPHQASRSTRLTRALESAREGKAGGATSEKNRGSIELQPLLDLKPTTEDQSKTQLNKSLSKARKSNQELMQEFMSGNNFDGDMTVDLNDPHSQSGKYWKAEFEQYHNDAQAEMKKLIKYKNLAKSFAKKKDAEALELAERLKEEQRRIVSMEDKVSKLSAQIATSGLEGQEDNSPELIKELARQTALAVQYRAQVEEFRKALEGNYDRTDAVNNEKRLTPNGEDQNVLEIQQELNIAREQLKEMAVNREELLDSKRRLSTAEEATKKLREENTRLTQELLHVDLRLEKETAKSEKRRLGFQERLKKKDEALQSLQKDYDSLKEMAKSQRRDAEQLLKKRHDQVVELKKELASKKGADEAAKELKLALEEKTAEHAKILADYQRQIQRLINTQSEDIQAVTLPTKTALTEDRPLATRMDATENELRHPHQSHIPVSSPKISRPSKTLPTMKHPQSENHVGSIGPQSLYSALSEITNGSSSDKSSLQKSASLKINTAADRLANLSLGHSDLPSPESFVTSQPPLRSNREKNFQASPRPSMFVIPSSPPKRAIIRPQTSGEIARQSSINDFATSSSRLLSLEASRSRSTLPPERVAAAKARLEQKMAQKKKIQAIDSDKENVHLRDL
jgi:hypothetical protein